ILTAAFVFVLVGGGFAFAACPSADLSGDCFVDFEDFAVVGAQWLEGYDWNDVNTLANQWLTTDPCVPDDMAYIPDGEFEMGDHFAEGDYDELPLHAVFLDSFFMSKYEVTNQQYCDYLNSAFGTGIYVSGGIVYGTGNNQFYCDTSAYSSYSQISFTSGVFSVRTKAGRDMSNDPMVEVSWYGSAAYCNWRSQREGYRQCYNLSTWDCDFSKNGYRLPTEAEWEYAARGGLSGRRFPWGDTISHSQANYRSEAYYGYDVSPTRGYHPAHNDGNWPYTAPVGSFSANGYGLYDMAGNVREWCNDWYKDSYYHSSPYSNPTGPASGGYSVLRGGSWGCPPYFCRVAFRDDIFYPGDRAYDSGFRVVLDLN
ncbi:MAG: formylglycine-generating enzyme family protein, partial [Planctomycetota bacterium]